jgi:small-conductance mechanosensitive channel
VAPAETPSYGLSKLLQPLADGVLARLGWPKAWDRAWPSGIIGAVVILALTYLLAFVLSRWVSRWLKKLAAHTTTHVDDEILAVGIRPFRRLLLCGGAFLALRELPLSPVGERMATGVVLVIATWVGARLATRVVGILLRAYGSKFADHDGQAQFEKDYVPLLGKIAGGIFGVVGIAAVLHHFGQSVASLVAALGIGGVAVSMAAKDVLANMFSGFVILMDRPFRPGDRIKLTSGELGDVIEVGTRSTRVRLLDQNLLIVPNGELVNARVVNLSYPAHPTRAQIELRLGYGTDVEKAKQTVRDVLGEQTEVIRPPPNVTLSAFGETSMTLLATYYISADAETAAVEDRIRTLVAQKLAAAEVSPLWVKR